MQFLKKTQRVLYLVPNYQGVYGKGVPKHKAALDEMETLFRHYATKFYNFSATLRPPVTEILSSIQFKYAALIFLGVN